MFFLKYNINDLSRCIEKNNIKKLTEILPKIADINEVFEYKNVKKLNIIIYSIYVNAGIDIIKLLLDNGADVNFRDENRNTPFLYAALYSDNIELFDMLKEYGADINALNVINANAVMAAVYNGYNILEKLIKMGININNQNTGGWSALMSVALDKKPLEMAKLLIDNGADINIKNKSDKTALDIAKEVDYKEMADLLQTK